MNYQRAKRGFVKSWFGFFLMYDLSYQPFFFLCPVFFLDWFLNLRRSTLSIVSLFEVQSSTRAVETSTRLVTRQGGKGQRDEFRNDRKQ